ncbi:MAG: hypothetical protein EOR51_19995 [Mesorhizobium sp.]|nr:MAG: hypothetical protein EOR51_19995 [Mesorhizobium sp.]
MRIGSARPSNPRMRSVGRAPPHRQRRTYGLTAGPRSTPVLDQSGESWRIGRISCCGDGMMRTLLYEAAQMLRLTKWSWLMGVGGECRQVAQPAKAIVALARRLGGDHASDVARQTIRAWLSAIYRSCKESYRLIHVDIHPRSNSADE